MPVVDGGRSVWLCRAAIVVSLLLPARISAATSSGNLSTRQLCDRLAHSDGATDPRRIASALDALRSRGHGAASAAETLSRLLPHRSKLFDGRDKDLVVRLRSYIIVTLSDIGVPASALPALIDVLAHVDERNSPLEVGAAAHAVRSLGSRGKGFTPYLVEALTARLSVEEFSLERFDVRFPPAEATTAHLEIVRALGRVASTDDRDLRATLGQLVADPERDPRLVREAQRLLDRRQRMSGTAAHALPPAASEFLPAPRRTRLKNLDIAYKDHDGRGGVLRNLADRPLLITFFYSRCQNSKKCSMAVSRLSALQRQLAQAGIDESVRLLAISYEPQFDTPERINRFASDRGLRLGQNALALQLDGAREQQLTDELQAPVNFSSGWVNTHGVELSLLDADGRVVRQYHTMLWDNDQVLKDVQRLLAER
jgi:protein SCO1/2